MDIQQPVFTKQNTEFEKASINQAEILGINWDIEIYNLSLREINKSFIPTKRRVLSVLCSIYDPLGFVAPCILESKLIISMLETKFGLGRSLTVRSTFKFRKVTKRMIFDKRCKSTTFLQFQRT